MNLIFVNRFYYPDESATSQMLTDLAEYLASYGYEVTVICSRAVARGVARELPSTEVINGVSVLRTGWRETGRRGVTSRLAAYLSFMVSGGIATWRAASWNSCVIVKTDPPLMGVVIGLVCKGRRCSLVNWLQDIFPEVAVVYRRSLAMFLISAPLRWIRNQSLKHARKNVVLGSAMHAVLLKEGLCEARVCTIPNWSKRDLIYPCSRSDNSLRAKWGLGLKFVVAYSGNLGRVHDLSSIIAMASSIAGHSDIQFLIIGDGAQLLDLQRKVRDYGLSNVMFKPFQSRNLLRESLGCADLHITTLKKDMEGFVLPSKVYGALAAGRPLLHLGDPNGEISTMLRAHECGDGFSPHEFESAANFVVDLARSTDKASRLGANARRLFLSEFDFAVSSLKWRKLLDDIAARHSN